MDYFVKYGVPRNCPVCGAKVEINDSGFPYCPNPECRQKLSHRFHRIFSVLEVKGAGPSFVDAMVSSDISVKKFFDMVKDNDAESMCRFAGGVNGNKILGAMRAKISEPITMAEYLALFDYDGFDEKKLKVLNGYSVEALFALGEGDIMKLNGFADITAKKLLSFFKDCHDEIEELSKYFIFEGSAGNTEKGDLDGLSFCFTGKACRPRSELEKIVTAHGGRVAGVSKGLSFLVTDDTESGSSKNVKAKELGIKVITSQEFLEMVEHV